MAYSTNAEILTAMSNLVATETQEVFNAAMASGTDLSSFQGVPMVHMNEFINTMVNKIVTQRVYDPLKFKNPFDIFQTDSPTFGETIELDASVLPTVEVYSEESTLGQISKPKVKVEYIYTRDKIKVTVSRSEQQIRAAFTKEGGLASLLALFTKQLFDARNLFLYDAVKEDLNKINIEHTLTSAGLTDSDAKEVYQEVINLAYDMELPSTEYNESGLMATLNSPILVLNTATAASFDVNVFASLFGASSIAEDKFFSKVIRIKDTENTDLVGYVLDADKYLWSNRILEVRDFYDGSNMVSTFWLHNWIIRGLNPHVNGVKLIKATEVEA